MEKQVSEGSLHKWFKGSKSKDGKGGWVNVVTGGTCASDEPGEGTPKCVSSAKRASMTKAERLSAARRKKKADPGQQQKSGAAKPTYVSTDKPKKKKMKETYERSLTPLTEKAKKCWPGYEKKGTKKMFGKTYNNCVKKEEVVYSEAKIDEKDPKNKRERRNVSKFGPQTKPYDPDTKEMKTSMSKHMQGMRQSMHKSKRGRKTRGPDAGMRTEAVNAAQQAAIAIAKKKKQEDDMVARKKKQKMYAGYEPQGEVIDEKNRGDQETRKKAKGYDSFTEKRPISKSEQGTREVVGRRNTTSAMNRSGMGMAKPERETKERGERHKADRGKKTKGTKEGHSGSAYPQRSHTMDTMYPHKKKARLSMMAKDKKSEIKRPGGRAKFYGTEKKPIPEELQTENIGKTIDKLGVKAVQYGAEKNIPGTQLLAKGLDFQRKLRSGKKGDGFIGDPKLNIKNPISMIGKQIEKNPAGFTIQNMRSSHEPEGETISEVKDKKGKGSGTKDACYHKVKSRYSVWPSAYASGALVKCRKVGAANWGNSSKKEEFSDWKSEFIWEDGDSSKKIEEDWQKTNRQDKTDGMSQKAVNAYKRENPGSKLKTAVTKKPSSLKRGSKDAKRRKSFCSRMKGMKKRLTSAKTARDPDSRINKALRRWNC